VNQSAALIDVLNIVNGYGHEIKLYYGTVSRDEYGSIISRTSTSSYTIKAFPITLNPTRKDIEKAGFTQTLDITVYLSKLDADRKGIFYDEINPNEWTLEYNGAEYTIKEKSLFSQFGSDFLYIVLGGHKK
jgi:hypothetical protein